MGVIWEHGVSVENMENMENMSNMGNIQNVNPDTVKDKGQKKKLSLLCCFFALQRALVVEAV